jgi:hypothetical protein
MFPIPVAGAVPPCMRPFLLLAMVVFCGCASTLSTLQTAETTPVRHLELKAGIGAFAPLGAVPHLAKALDIEKASLQHLATSGSHPVPPVEQRDALLDAALSVLLQTPGPVWEIGARFGLTSFWDVGARLSSNDWALDSKVRLFKRPLGKELTHSAALDLRYAHVDISNPLVTALDFVNMGGFSRFDVEATGLYTINARDQVRLYGGPKAVYTRFEFDERAFKFGNAATDFAGLPPLAGSLHDTMWFFGGVGGLAATYKRATVYTELNAGYTRLRPELFGKKRNLGGLTLYPAVGVGFAF